MVKQPSDEEVEELAVNPIIESQDGQFNLALVLNGTVSSGAYTAGVLDFLVEALDAFQKAQDSGMETDSNGLPILKHKVKLALAAGASGGGVCAAILARVLDQEFPHVRVDTDEATAQRNPFYNTWVNKLSIEAFTTTSDLKPDQPILSLLNAKAIDDAATAIINSRGLPLGSGTSPEKRGYIHDPFRAIFTLFNLRGVPYRIQYGSSWQGAQYYTDHADWISFRVPIDGQPAPVPNEYTLSDSPAGPHEADWAKLATFAVATGAFPGGFAARELSRPASHYQYRVETVPQEDKSKSWAVLQPVFEAMGITSETQAVDFVSVDGGTANNAPFEIARTRLSGLLEHNPRDPKKAHSGVLLIDPFADKPDLTDTGDTMIVKALLGTLGGLKDQARYATSDLLLALQDDVCSRFMISPYSGFGRGSPAIATSGLGAFLGFFDKSFRRHDYFLGRQNCQQYLKTELSVHPANKVFVDDAQVKAKHIFQSGGKQWLPLIPLYDRAADPQPVEPWPSGNFDEDAIRDLVERRLDKFVDQVTDNLEIGGWLTRQAIELVVDSRIRDKLVKIVMPIIEKAVKDSKL